MKKILRINYIFWKEGPLLFDVAHTVPASLRESKLPRLLASQQKSRGDFERKD